MAAEKSWKQIHLDHIHFAFRAKAEEWSKEERLHDDRLVFCNIYRLMEEALNSLPDEPNNYVCVAMNRKMEADRQILNEILAVFENR